ncbi:MAG: Stk1 family PASTA domain-containing Ser/Thr kinase [Oscillospiraceae bacterium]|nr:Stk1 family PASTA domain-containing Ser/Thr kinase [Oscillospiraceae bacterium]
MDNNIGKKLDGRYELLELIGVGGMADIYRARDVQEDRIVAVKILKTEFAGSEEFLRRFRNESKAIALLSHPNIVKIYDVGFTDKVQFIVMEYVDGITLTDYIEQQGVLKWRDAVHFTVQVLKALQHAHDRGIVHRDVKSSNVMLLRDGTIKVMDFGIARFNRENNKTMSEKTIGSVHYISPEQARGDITDERSDIYSVGVALYEMLTGKKPFDGDTPVAIALKHMQSNPKRPTEINETIPEGLEQIVLRAMQKEPSARYQTAGEMISDLEDFKKNPGIVFDYKYNSTDGTAKFADRVNPAVETETARRKKMIESEELDEDYDDDDDDDDDDEEYEERRSPLIPILFAVGAAFVIATVFLVLILVSDRFGTLNNRTSDSSFDDSDLGISISQNGEFSMPNLVGEDWDVIAARYAGGDLLKLEPEQQWSEYTQNQIFDQSIPEGRRVKKGETIIVKVSRGIRQEEIQDFTNRTVAAAEQQLRKDGFVPQKKFEENEDIPKDYVIKTIPAAHERAPVNSTVYIIVSMGPKNVPVLVDNYVGMPIDEVQKRCDELKIIPIITMEDSDEPEGQVIAQEPVRGTYLNQNEDIKLKVSTGKTPEGTKTIEVALPSGISGEFQFKYYVDSVLDSAATETRDVSLSGSKSLRYDVKGKVGETKEVAIKAVSLATGREDTFIRVEVKFGENDKPVEKSYKPEVFAELLNAAPISSSSTESSSEPPESSVPSVPGFVEPGDDNSSESDDSSDSGLQEVPVS